MAKDKGKRYGMGPRCSGTNASHPSENVNSGKDAMKRPRNVTTQASNRMMGNK